MICPSCNSFTNNPRGHTENPWACIAVLKERNNRLQNQVIDLQEQLDEMKVDMHATETLLEVKAQYDVRDRS